MGQPPLNPILLSGARPYANPLSATPSNLCKTPQEGLKFVPMTFNFSQNAAWLVDLGLGSPNRPLEQLCMLYADCSQSQHDCIILFPDSGYQVPVAFGETKLFPVLTGKSIPKFYVILNDAGQTNTTDIINIFAINQFIPEFSASSFAQSVSYGYGEFFELQPTFTQSRQFSSIVPDPNFALPITIINAQQWYVTAISAYLTINGAAGIQSLELQDAGIRFIGTSFLTQPIVGRPYYQELINLAGLNIISSGNGPLTAFVSNPATLAGSNYFFSFNISGGILVP